jgi:hypothetical protein
VQAAGDEALMVFAADKVSKARRKLAHYRHCAQLLEERLADSPLVESLRRELAQLTLVERAALVGTA